MTARQTDKTTYWRALQMHLRRGTRDNYGITPLVPTSAMLAICQRISTKTKP
jgi:hypothetical protein